MSNDEEINELLAEIELNDESDMISPLSTVQLDSVSLEEENDHVGGEIQHEEERREQELADTETHRESDSATAHPVPEAPTAPTAAAVPEAAPEVAREVAPDAQPEGSGKRPHIPDEVKEAASMAATVTREAAADVAKEFSKISNQAQSFFSNMWQQFDPLAGAAPGQAAEKTGDVDVKQRFGLASETEKLLESFRCTLIQTYAPSDNTFTPIKAIGFTGCFHILDSHIAFEFDNVASNGKPIVIPLSEVNEVDRDPANGGSIVCRLIGGRTFCVGRFVHGALELDSAEQLLRTRR